MRLRDVKKWMKVDVVDKRKNTNVLEGYIVDISEDDHSDFVKILLDTGYEIFIKRGY